MDAYKKNTLQGSLYTVKTKENLYEEYSQNELKSRIETIDLHSETKEITNANEMQGKER